MQPLHEHWFSREKYHEDTQNSGRRPTHEDKQWKAQLKVKRKEGKERKTSDCVGNVDTKREPENKLLLHSPVHQFYHFSAYLDLCSYASSSCLSPSTPWMCTISIAAYHYEHVCELPCAEWRTDKNMISSQLLSTLWRLGCEIANTFNRVTSQS